MSKQYLIVSLLTCMLAHVGSAAVPQIQFSGKKDWVITSVERGMVLKVVDEHLNSKESDFLVQLDDFESPFPVEVVEAVEPQRPSVTSPGTQPVVAEKPPTPIVYDDASVLRVVGENFAKQVRGTLARGDQNYIQLQGGNLLKTDSSFPVRLPDAQDKTYIVRLIEVTADDYTLSLGDAILTLPYSDGATGARKTP